MARSRAIKLPTGEPSPFNVLRKSPRKASEPEVEEIISDDEESDISDTSEGPEQLHKTVTRSVLEEIAKFEESFKDFAKRYRLIDRIGEGKLTLLFVLTGILQFFAYRNIFYSLQSRGPSL